MWVPPPPQRVHKEKLNSTNYFLERKIGVNKLFITYKSDKKNLYLLKIPKLKNILLTSDQNHLSTNQNQLYST